MGFGRLLTSRTGLVRTLVPASPIMERGRWTHSLALAFLAFALAASALFFALDFWTRSFQRAWSSGVGVGTRNVGFDGPGSGAVVLATAVLTGSEAVANLVKARCFFKISMICSCVSSACSTVLGASIGKMLGGFSPLTTLAYLKGATPVWECPWY